MFIFIVVGSMAASRQTQYWRSSWELYILIHSQPGTYLFCTVCNVHTRNPQSLPTQWHTSSNKATPLTNWFSLLEFPPPKWESRPTSSWAVAEHSDFHPYLKAVMWWMTVDRYVLMAEFRPYSSDVSAGLMCFCFLRIFISTFGVHWLREMN